MISPFPAFLEVVLSWPLSPHSAEDMKGYPAELWLGAVSHTDASDPAASPAIRKDLYRLWD